ncbi:hypothetical protein [Robiginitalea sp.]|uniref:hypothetical protein n=1 Tax=Robiginitalea sp. TaxID=1902411 RepID=UPI003C43C101
MRYLSFFVFLFLLSACNQRNSSTIGSSISDSKLTPPIPAVAIQAILDVPDLQPWLHGEIPERVPLKVVSSEFVREDYNLYKFGHKVRIIDTLTLRAEFIEDAIIIQFYDTDRDTIKFGLTHPIEGAFMSGSIFEKDEKWNVLVKSMGEVGPIQFPCLDLQKETSLLQTILRSDEKDIKDFVNYLKTNKTNILSINGLKHFKPMYVSVKDHKFYVLTSDTPKYDIGIQFHGGCSKGRFELGNNRYAVFGNFRRNGNDWCLENIGVIEID